MVLKTHRISSVAVAIGAPNQAQALFHTRVWHRFNPVSAECEAPDETGDHQYSRDENRAPIDMVMDPILCASHVPNSQQRLVSRHAPD